MALERAKAGPDEVPATGVGDDHDVQQAVADGSLRGGLAGAGGGH
jgi:hypothetical protein